MGAGYRRRLAAAVIVAAAAGTGSTWAAAQDPSPSSTSDTFTSAWDVPTAPVPAVDASTRASFAIFREQPATGMPADAEEQVGSSQRFGRNPSLARSIDTVNGTGWVIPGDGFICIAMKDPIDGYGTGCVPTAVAARQGVAIRLGSNGPDGRVAEAVLVPDGMRAVRGDGSAVPLHDGVASIESVGEGQLRVAP